MSLSITTDWHALDRGAPEERATFCALGIQAGDVWLTEGRDQLANALRRAPYLSAYFLAEWLAWNWWRLRWEPRDAERPDWRSSHNMASIGHGYLWPDLTIHSDDVRTVLAVRPTREHPSFPYRYLNDWTGIVPATGFEGEVDRFTASVLERLESEGVAETNLHAVWRDVQAERADPELSWRRKLEALMGKDADEGDEAALAQLAQDKDALGAAPVEELAAAARPSQSIPTREELHSIAESAGVEQKSSDVLSVAPPERNAHPAWRIGRDLACAARRALNNVDAPLGNEDLAGATGVAATVLTGPGQTAPFAFSLDEAPTVGRIVLGPRREDSRRFALARLLGDHLAYRGGGALHPATRARTYRQQLQRSFAAELLCPIEALEEFLRGDFSDERQEAAAEHFNVSPRAVLTLLVNYRRVERDALAPDVDATDRDAA